MIFVTRAFALPLGLRTEIRTCRRPSAGVQASPVVRLTSPSCAGDAGVGGAAAGGAGTTGGPKSVQSVQPPVADHAFCAIEVPRRANTHSWASSEAAAAGAESIDAGSSSR